MSLRDLLRELVADVADLKHRLAQMIQVGPVVDADAAKGYRLDLGVDAQGETRKSPWLPHPDSGGAASTWMPLSKGQIAALLAPGGDLRQAFMVRNGFGGGNDPPSQDLGEVVLLAHGDVRVSATTDRFIIKVGAGSIDLTADTLKFVVDTVQALGTTLKHNAKSVGDTHGHVSAPDGPPGPPV